MNGKFVTFEGCEGVGKSTQLRQLKKYLESTGQEAVFTREPGGNPISEQIRRVILDTKNTAMDPMCEALLYAASRAQLIAQVIRPALNAGKLVICDRSLDSSIAYQGAARGLGEENVLNINHYALGDCMPDLTIFIDLAPSEAWRSRAKSALIHDRLEHETAEFHEKVYKGYLKAVELSGGRIIKVRPSVDKDETTARIIEVLRKNGMIK